jgi:hypothetical protein
MNIKVCKITRTQDVESEPNGRQACSYSEVFTVSTEITHKGDGVFLNCPRKNAATSVMQISHIYISRTG